MLCIMLLAFYYNPFQKPETCWYFGIFQQRDDRNQPFNVLVAVNHSMDPIDLEAEESTFRGSFAPNGALKIDSESMAPNYRNHIQ